MTDTNELLDELAHARDRDEVLVLDDGGLPEKDVSSRKAYLGGGPDHYASHVFDDSPGPERKTVERDVAKQMVDSWNVVGFETVRNPDNYQPPEWVAKYETTTFRGPLLYPVPEDWDLGTIEMGVTAWERPPRPDPDSEYWEQNDSWEPEAEALAFTEWESDGGFNPDETAITQFSVDGEDLFEVKDAYHDNLMGPIAEILARVAYDEDLKEIVDDVDLPGPQVEAPPTAEEIAAQNGSTLGDFAGGRDE
jgi:hypothetical protein